MSDSERFFFFLLIHRSNLQSITPLLPFKSITLIEPLVSPAGAHHLKKLRTLLIKSACERRDVWPTRERAIQTLKTRPRTGRWDERCMKLFVVVI
jgi:hypothetical protein